MMAVWWQKYIGIPFADNGRSMQGVDCGGLAWLVYKQECGRELDCFSLAYHTDKVREVAAAFRREIPVWFMTWPESPPAPFALAVFGRKAMDYHVGVFTDPWHIIHAKDGEHVKRVRFDDLPFAADYRGAYVLK